MVLPIVRRVYPAAALAWAAMLPLATYAATRVHASMSTHAFAFAMYSIGSLICHQRPERSFHLWAAKLPVCARCTGIYVAAAAAAIAYRSPKGSRSIAPERSLAPEREPSAERMRRARGWLLLAALPTIATLVYEWTTGDMPSNGMRFAAGLPLGAVVSWLVLTVN